MCAKNNSKEPQQLESPGLFCGLDWARHNHYFCLQDAQGNVLEEGYFENSAEGFEQWLQRLQRHRQGGSAALIYEAHRSLPLAAILPQDWLILLPVNPSKTRKLNELEGSGRGKSDGRDSRLLCDYARLHWRNLLGYLERSGVVLALRNEVGLEETLGQEYTKSINRIKALLAQLCPPLIRLIPNWKAAVYQEYLLELDLNDLMEEPALRQWLRDHHLFHSKKLEEFIAGHLKLRPLVQSSPLQQALTAQLRSLVRLMQRIGQELEECQQRIEALFKQLPQASIYRSMPSMGPRLAPRLASLLGSRPSQAYEAAAQIQAYFGQSPVTESTGGKDRKQRQPGELERKKVLKRRSCNRLGRQVMFLWSRSCSMARKDTWQKAYLKKHKAKGDLPGTRHRKLGKKLLGVLIHCLQNNVHYDDDIYCKNLHARL